ncbi:MAG: response regulator [Pseudomonadota bacterium]
MKILIVDDDLVSRKTLQKLMTSIGECEAVENGEDALRAAEMENPPDLILLDIMMPGLDGLEVCRRLKAAPGTKDIPVIFLSANTRVEDITRGFEMGAVDYVTKPFRREEVKARVRTHLSLKKMREDLHAKNIVLQEQVREIREKTEQLRQRDLQLIEMDRIAGIGALAAGIAHEINNPLGFVKSSVGFLKKSLDRMIEMTGYWDNRPFSEDLLKEYKNLLDQLNFQDLKGSLDKRFDRANRGIERIMRIVSSLRSFSRLDMEAMGEIDLNRTMEEAIELLSTQEIKDVQFIREFRDVPPMECFPAEINQVLLHILKNAVDALGGSGTITLSTSYDMEGDQISINVIDNGRGMSPEILRQAFNPFFTTKPVGSGTGVGLSLAEKIVRRHGGRIDITSKEGEGTAVVMTFPAVCGQGGEPARSP